jgi:hypothetical protein
MKIFCGQNDIEPAVDINDIALAERRSDDLHDYDP